MSVIRRLEVRFGRGVNGGHGRLVWRERGLKIGCGRWGRSFRRWVWLFCVTTETPMDIMPLWTTVIRILKFGLMPSRALEGGRGLPARIG